MIRKISAHAAIILSGMYVVFFFIDRVNSAMGFINNKITKALLLILCVVSILNAALIIAAQRRLERKRARAAQPAAPARSPAARPGYGARSGYSANRTGTAGYTRRPTGRY